MTWLALATGRHRITMVVGSTYRSISGPHLHHHPPTSLPQGREVTSRVWPCRYARNLTRVSRCFADMEDQQSSSDVRLSITVGFANGSPTCERGGHCGNWNAKRRNGYRRMKGALSRAARRWHLSAAARSSSLQPSTLYRLAL
jgi:hypothetical protein